MEMFATNLIHILVTYGTFVFKTGDVQSSLPNCNLYGASNPLLKRRSFPQAYISLKLSNYRLLAALGY